MIQLIVSRQYSLSEAFSIIINELLKETGFVHMVVDLQLIRFLA